MRAYLLMIAVSAIVTFLATHLVIKITRKYKIYPEIRSRDSHSVPTPRLGGLGMFAGFLVAMGTAASLGWFKSVFVADGPIMGVLIAASIIAILGALDDVYDLDWMLKLGGQFVAAGILAWNGVQIVSLPIGGITIGSFGMSFTVSVFLTVLIMNAVNRNLNLLRLQLPSGSEDHTEQLLQPGVVDLGHCDWHVSRVPSSQLAPGQDIHG
ncbi:MAG: MraY family glycosyltransferase [Rhodoluna sp.]|nr:MraY family glycosyltransferase [Rhodoluna sp.]